MAELFDILGYYKAELPVPIADASNAYPVDVDTVAANEVQSRIQEDLAAGEYTVTVVHEATINSTSNAIYTRSSGDGGATWKEGSRNVANSGDNSFLTYEASFTHAGGAIDFVLQMRKESANNTLAVSQCSIWIKRAN